MTTTSHTQSTPFAGPLPRPVRVNAHPLFPSLRVSAVVPCYNRPQDLDLLLTDLAALDTAGTQLSVLIIDNASTEPISVPRQLPSIDIRVVRMDENRGGAGGYNAGMRAALNVPAADRPDMLWLVDSDARLEPDTLAELLAAMRDRPDAIMAGAAIRDPGTGHVFELGGRINPITGSFEPAHTGAVGIQGPVEVEYAAACCALVRADAVTRGGVMPDVFLNGDDVEWCVRLRKITGGSIIAVPTALATHPTFDRFATWTRYYVARNAFGPIRAAGLGRGALFARAMREVVRAVQQQLMARPDLVRLHTRGLRDAATGRTDGPAPTGTIDLLPQRPLSELEVTIRELISSKSRQKKLRIDAQLEKEDAIGERIARLRAQHNADAENTNSRARTGEVDLVDARGRRGSWRLGLGRRTVVQICAGGFVVRRPSGLACLLRAGATLGRGLALACRIAATTRSDDDPKRWAGLPVGELTLSDVDVVVLSYNRSDRLMQTLRTLIEDEGLNAEQVVVVDNGSTDDSAKRVRSELPGVRVVALAKNIGVDAFNKGVEACERELVLILDDDAWVGRSTLGRAVGELNDRPDLAGVALVPVHPQTQRREWMFASQRSERAAVFGSANLVHRWAWQRVGGYEAEYFLYRNDMDLAMKLRAIGLGVLVDPELIGWHDSAFAARKSVRWHRLATRNWVWSMRRHGGLVRGTTGVVLGWAWAHKLSGLSVSRHAATLRGAVEGLVGRSPKLPTGVQRGDGVFGVRWLLRAQMRRGR